jgi:hypothetical protein
MGEEAGAAFAQLVDEPDQVDSSATESVAIYARVAIVIEDIAAQLYTLRDDLRAASGRVRLTI